MNNHVKDFLLDFFRTKMFEGWRSVATSLLEKGECIVAGEGNLWIGGVGNFIEKENAEGLVGCTKLTLDVEKFLNSKYVEQYIQSYRQKAVDEVEELQNQLDYAKAKVKAFDNMLTEI